MIKKLEGVVDEKLENSLIVRVMGIGLEVICDLETLEKAEVGEEISLHTSLVIGDDLKLYGFSDSRKRDLFEKLMKVSKVGPKLALKMISAVDFETLVSLIKSGDVEGLAKLPGVGTKTAERVVAELRKDLREFEVEGVKGFSQAIEALQALGYSLREATDALRAVAKAGMEVEELIREALRVLRR